ncbi:hypothetical protein FBY06_14028 [Pseudomonas sp. SJZ085]|uniref:contractile injection system protein, VgrG/Pvc8 family n=1 Tax=unclassified Pseudomonas TaxID=196821 RepID=UPI00119B1B69|nr:MULTISPECIES: contractile injection system protein, VgrG/Pvc8 family [unclassified Pseudomonas]TWC12024.1 hypothetical protein FBX99_13928 [Pseudomonas sp. SJZ074]TWC30605.1 hypothetical protein FBY06_14028 [Pseudomonas sp. SJZ085]
MAKADYRITANDADITGMIRKRFIKLTLQDSAGEDSDTVAIELDNRDNMIRLPSTGAELKVWIGEPGALIFKGAYQVDELEVPLDDEALVIHGKAAKMLGGIKSPKDATFDDMTLGALVAKIAKEHGYEAAVAPELAGHAFKHIDQRAESDMNLLTRLSRDLGAVAKPVGGKLVVVPKGQAKSVSGKALSAVAISDPKNSSGRVTIQERNDYSSTVAYWFDEKEQRKVPAVAEVVEGKVAVPGEKPNNAGQAEEDAANAGGPRYIIRKTYPDQKSAQEAAAAKLKQMQRGKSTMSITRPLTPQIVAEGQIVVSNHTASANRVWAVESVTHVIGSGEVASTSAECVTPSK